jgi:hypothetical protein
MSLINGLKNLFFGKEPSNVFDSILDIKEKRKYVKKKPKALRKKNAKKKTYKAKTKEQSNDLKALKLIRRERKKQKLKEKMDKKKKKKAKRKAKLLALKLEKKQKRMARAEKKKAKAIKLKDSKKTSTKKRRGRPKKIQPQEQEKIIPLETTPEKVVKKKGRPPKIKPVVTLPVIEGEDDFETKGKNKEMLMKLKKDLKNTLEEYYANNKGNRLKNEEIKNKMGKLFMKLAELSMLYYRKNGMNQGKNFSDVPVDLVQDEIALHLWKIVQRGKFDKEKLNKNNSTYNFFMKCANNQAMYEVRKDLTKKKGWKVVHMEDNVMNGDTNTAKDDETIQ